MYMNSMEEIIFEKCVDSRLLEDPAAYCSRTIVPTLDFTLWTKDNKDKGCIEAGDVVKTQCVDNPDDSEEEQCFPCAYLISYIFSKYEKYTTTAVENVFDLISQDYASTLRKAAQAVIEGQGEQSPEEKAQYKTLEIQFPKELELQEALN